MTSSLSLHSSALPFSGHTPFTNDMRKFAVHSFHQEISSDDDADDDYAPTRATKPMKAREFKLKTRAISAKSSSQAVIEWYMIALDKKAALRKSAVKEDALGHLLSSGWSFFYIPKKDRQELRYKAPNGKVYISLRTACKAYIDQGGFTVSDHSVTQKNDSQPVKVTVVTSLEKPEVESEPVKSPETCMEILFEKPEAESPEPAVSSFEKPEDEQEIVRSALPSVQNFEKETTVSPFDQEREDEPEIVKSPLPSVQNIEKENAVSSFGQILGKPQLLKAAKGSVSRRNPRTGLSYLMEHGLVSPGDRVYYDAQKKDCPLYWGSISNKGKIKCDCCSNPFAISKFEAHIGSTKHRPAANIFLEDGRSLLDCQKQLNQSKHHIQNDTKASTKKVNNNNNAAHSDTSCLDKNDCICSLCHFGGELILCDLCPAAFHPSCLGLNGIPSGDWYCCSCCCKICGQVTYDFNDQASSVDKSFVKCVQCEQNVHIGCVKSIQVLEGDSNQTIDRENWFCTKRCKDIHVGLQKLLWKPIPVGNKNENLTWTLMKHCPNNMTGYQRKKLNIALGVMHKSFRPVKDPISKNDLIEDVILSKRSESKRLNFGGFYTVALERKNIMMTVATIRVYGDDIAEIPLVATQLRYRRQGMCRRLMNELEHQLIEIGVKKMTLAAVSEALNTWTNGFGFFKMTDLDRLELIKYTFLGFQHTVVCQKDLLEKVRISSHVKSWPPTKKMKQSCLDYEFYDNMYLDDWSSIAEAF